MFKKIILSTAACLTLVQCNTLKSDCEALAEREAQIAQEQAGDYYIGRTEFDSPDVDTEVLINVNEGELLIGNFYNVRITDATEFDLMGTVEK